MNVEPYLASWITKHYGDPVELIKDSPEARLLKRLLDVPPKAIAQERGNITVRLPYFKEKDPRTYSYLCESGKTMLVESFETLFLNNMWTEIGSIENINCQLTTVIRAWCEKHGIIVPTDSITNVAALKEIEEANVRNLETVRQKYYRLRKKYFRQKGVKLS